MTARKKKSPVSIVSLLLFILFAGLTVLEIIYSPHRYSNESDVISDIPVIANYVSLVNFYLFKWFSAVAYLIPPLLAYTLLISFLGEKRYFTFLRYLSFLIIVVLGTVFLSFVDILIRDKSPKLGGEFGSWLSEFIAVDGVTGWAVIIGAFLVLIVLLFKISLRFKVGSAKTGKSKKTSESHSTHQAKSVEDEIVSESDETSSQEQITQVSQNQQLDEGLEEPEKSTPVTTAEDIETETTSPDTTIEQEEKAIDLKPIPSPVFEFDISELGQAPKNVDTEEEDLENVANEIKEKYAEFDVFVDVTPAGSGPVLAIFNIKPHKGVKVNSIVKLQRDISIALGRGSIRFNDPTPSGAGLQCEVPLFKRKIVSYQDAYWDYERISGAEPDLILGSTIAGGIETVQFKDLPHLLVGGSTGSGKSVFLNSIIVHLAINFDPKEVRLVLMDAKRLEFNPYESLPHLSCPIVTEANEAQTVLEELVNEMERRYEFLKDKGFRQISEYIYDCYNNHVESELTNVVVIIDELAEFIMTGEKGLVDAMIRIAQKARAVGIHLVVATQRPSADIVSGALKANFPSRMSFKVATDTDSRVILDSSGAEDLLGKGDMLFTTPGKPIQRYHGCLLTTAEVNNFSEFWKNPPSEAIEA